MLLSDASRRDPEPRSMRERLEAAVSGLAELEQLRQKHEALVRSALEAREMPSRLRRDARERPEEEALQENILLLRKQLNCLRRRDVGLITQLQELDRQISELRLDSEVTHDPLEADSRPSSGFFDLSDEASISLSNSSNSVFSECFCAVAEADAHILAAEEQPTCQDCTVNSAHHGDKPYLPSLGSAPLPLSAFHPAPPSPHPGATAVAAAAPQKRLDGYILGLLQRRAPPVRPGRPRTGISTEPSRGLRSGPPWAGGGALPGGCAIQKVFPDSGDIPMEKMRLPPPLQRLPPLTFPTAPAASCAPPEAACRGQEVGGLASRGGGAPQGKDSKAAAVSETCGRSRRSSSKDPDANRSARRRCQRHNRPRTPILPSLPPRDQQLKRSGARLKSRSGTTTGKQPISRSAHRLRPQRQRQATGSELQYSGASASLLPGRLVEAGDSTSSCFGDGESVQENQEEDTSGRGRGHGRPHRHEVTRAVVRIKASHQLKKKILRFRSGSLKLMTTV